MGRGTWTDEAVAMLRDLVPVASFGIIAERMGKTRNAVIGKAKRLGLVIEPGRERDCMAVGGDTRSPERTTRPRVRRTFVIPPSRNRVPRVPILRAAPPIAPRQAPVRIVGLTLDALTFADGAPAECRYIVKSDRFETLYCGAPVEAGRSYCPPHCAICFNGFR